MFTDADGRVWERRGPSGGLLVPAAMSVEEWTAAAAKHYATAPQDIEEEGKVTQ
jgi:hypothetical protein